MLDCHDAILEVLILLLYRGFLTFQLFHLLALAFPTGLSCCSVPEYALYPALFLFIFSLCSFPVEPLACMVG